MNKANFECLCNSVGRWIITNEYLLCAKCGRKYVLYPVDFRLNAEEFNKTRDIRLMPEGEE